MHGIPPNLDEASCRQRQSRVLSLLEREELDGATFFNRFYIYALTGYWHEQPLTPTALFLASDGVATLITHEETPDAPAIDDLVDYIPNHLFTFKENLPGCVAEKLNPLLKGHDQIGTDNETPAAMISDPQCVDLTSEYQEIRRFKFPDEVEALRFTIRCADKAYEEGKKIIEPGMSEVDVMASMHRAATLEAGEMLSGFGQDYRCGAPGGFARRRSIESGEIFVLDVGIGVRGYRSDLCRSFAVNGEPTEAQAEAHARILEMFGIGESMMMPGQSCREMHEIIEKELDGWKGYRFFHHSGHGIGLDAHECPRINPKWDDLFQVGDVVAFEPGLYGEALNGGIRVENNFYITENGPEKLSHFPMDL